MKKGHKLHLYMFYIESTDFADELIFSMMKGIAKAIKQLKGISKAEVEKQR